MITPRRRPAPTFHPVTVADISQLTPRMRRITFPGDKLAEYPNDGPATHFKVLLPALGQAEVTVPEPGPDLTLPGGRGACWVGLEAAAMRAVRRHLIDERGLEKQQLYTRAYWKLGVADHPDHDTGEN